MRIYRLCFVGFGNVARHLARILAERQEFLERRHDVRFEVSAIADVAGAAIAPEGGAFPPADLIALADRSMTLEQLPGFVAGRSALEALAAAEADVMIELTPTRPQDGQPALGHMLAAFGRGMHVVTANKGPLVAAFGRLMDAARDAGRMIKFGCATAAALPTTNIGHYDLAGCEIMGLRGILNGTSNFILSAMHREGGSFAEALREAQGLGIAETDPTLDVDGYDAALKLVILANALMDADARLPDVSVRGIRDLDAKRIADAAAEGRAYKLVAAAERDASGLVALSVAPQAVRRQDPLFAVEGTSKAVVFSTDLMGDLLVAGGASHPAAAAAAILRDLINLAREDRR